MRPKLNGIDHCHLNIQSLTQAVDWYEKVLGFTVVEELAFWMRFPAFWKRYKPCEKSTVGRTGMPYDFSTLSWRSLRFRHLPSVNKICDTVHELSPAPEHGDSFLTCSVL